MSADGNSIVDVSNAEPSQGGCQKKTVTGTARGWVGYVNVYKHKLTLVFCYNHTTVSKQSLRMRPWTNRAMLWYFMGIDEGEGHIHWGGKDQDGYQAYQSAHYAQCLFSPILCLRSAYPSVDLYGYADGTWAVAIHNGL